MLLQAMTLRIVVPLRGRALLAWEDREVRRYREEESSSSVEEGSVPSLN